MILLPSFASPRPSQFRTGFLRPLPICFQVGVISLPPHGIISTIQRSVGNQVLDFLQPPDSETEILSSLTDGYAMNEERRAFLSNVFGHSDHTDSRLQSSDPQWHRTCRVQSHGARRYPPNFFGFEDEFLSPQFKVSLERCLSPAFYPMLVHVVFLHRFTSLSTPSMFWLYLHVRQSA